MPPHRLADGLMLDLAGAPVRLLSREAVHGGLKLEKKVTPKGMRRTFQDFARHRYVDDIVTRAISGHVTEATQHHYSTVAPEGIRKGVAEIVSVTGLKRALEAA